MHFHSFFSGWTCLFRRVSKLKIRGKNFFHLHQSQGGNLVDCCELLAHQSISVNEEIQGIALNSGSSHSHLSNFLSPRLLRADTDLTLCQLTKHQQAPVLRLRQHPLQGKKDGHSAGWLSGPLCPPNIPQSPLPQFPPLTRGFAFHYALWCVTLSCRFVFNVCDRIHLTGSERKWGDFFFFLRSNGSHSIPTFQSHSSLWVLH